MKAFSEIICLCGIMIFNLMLCSADDALSETKIKEIYKLDPDITDGKNYKVMKGEIIKKPNSKITMKVEIRVKKRTADKTTESYISEETAVFKDLKKGKTDLLSESVVDMLDYGYYDGKKVIIIPRLGKNLKEYSSKPYSWEKLSEIGPSMIKAIRFLHSKHYIHRNLKPEVFAFGTEEKPSDKEAVPLKKKVYLFDVGLAGKYRHSNGSHRASKKHDEYLGDLVFASRRAMANKTQSRRDDLESLYYIFGYLAGISSPFVENDVRKVLEGKNKFCEDLKFIKSVFKKSKITDFRVFYALFDFAQDLSDLFEENGYEKEPEYDDFGHCFDQGLTEEKIISRYECVKLNYFEDKSAASSFGTGNTTTDPKNKMEVIMKLLRDDPDPSLEWINNSGFRTELRVYKDLKKGMKHSLIREHICDMFDYGVYKGRRAIMMSHLGLDWFKDQIKNFPNGYPYESLCKAARCAISALRFLHKKGYVHQDLKVENFAFGRVEAKKNDKTQADLPLKDRLYLFDFDETKKWRYSNGTHKPRIHIGQLIGTGGYFSSTSIKQYSQSRRDDMESLMYAFSVSATGTFFFVHEEEDDEDIMLKERKAFLTTPGKMVDSFKKHNVSDARIHKAFTDYAVQLNKLFVSDEPEYYEKEPDYNAFCVCFGGKPGKDACAVE